MRNRGRVVVLSLLMVLTFVLGLGGGVVLDRQVLAGFVPPATIPAGAEPQFQLIAEAWNTIERSFVDRADVQPQQLANGAISGMVEALGDTGHSRFLTAAQAQRSRNALQGQLEGIGIEVQMKDNRLVVVAPIDNSPAQRAGLKPGDVILKVNGQDVAGLPLDEAIDQILGPAGTSVMLTILDPVTESTRTVTLVRAKITLDNLTWAPIPGNCIAQVRVASFSKGVTDDLRQSLADIQRRGLRGVVLDLRNNPGGLVDEAIGVASTFLKSGDVLLEQDAQGSVRHIQVQPIEDTYDGPLAVLINGGTASASEIVAGALQDHGRARVFGTTTFGTGTVLNEFRLSNGSVLLLATEKWLTPNGRLIWHHGIAPDVEVTLPPDTAPLWPEDLQRMTSAQLQSSGDAQLLRATQALGAAGAC